MKYYLIAGEASGDLHGSNLMKGLLKQDSEAEFRFWGGDKMAAVGGTLVQHYKESAVMGLMEVIAKLGKISGNIIHCQQDILEYRPDVVILIDYPGFNLKIARFCHEKGIRTFYYIAPKVWAWNESRVKLIRKWVDKVFVIFPFEVEYFRGKGIEPVYCGNPLLDSIAQDKSATETRSDFLA
ncbi:MAG: lipid-A-disaccharide synthase, partial [Bacteroidales bacterium]|nr:lipid-A-disaccharide synthase [Bacteroidales bacterium]